MPDKKEFVKHPGPRVTSIQLGNLDLPEIDQLVRATIDSFDSKIKQDTVPLSTIICAKTQGNALCVVQFLHMLRQNGMFITKHGNNTISWDILQIQAETNVSMNVEAMLSDQIEKLDPTVQRILQLAACLGFRFNVEMLIKLIAEFSKKDAVVTRSFIFPNGKTYSKMDVETALVLAKKRHLVEDANDSDMKFTHDIEYNKLSVVA